jgi:predicted DNA binding CopG/RHH family protein
MKAKVQNLRAPAMAASEGRDLDWSKALRVTMPNLKFTTETISPRRPVPLLHTAKRKTNRRNLPYQSLIKLVPPVRFFDGESLNRASAS